MTVGDAGNAADADTGYGAVVYEYRMGKYDVTAGQYAVLECRSEGVGPVWSVQREYGLFAGKAGLDIKNAAARREIIVTRCRASWTTAR